MTAFTLGNFFSYVAGAFTLAVVLHWFSSNENDDSDGDGDGKCCDKCIADDVEHFHDRMVLFGMSDLQTLSELSAKGKKDLLPVNNPTSLVHLFDRAKSPQSRYLISLRHSKQISQKKLAKLIGVRNVEISHWENDHPIPRITARRISRRFNLPIGRLIDDDS